MTLRLPSRARPSATVFAVLALALSATPLPGYAKAGGNSASHMSAEGLANTNGPNSADRDFGRDRASDRAHLHGNSLVTHGHGK